MSQGEAPRRPQTAAEGVAGAVRDGVARVAAALEKPRLRGWSHCAMTPLAVLGTVVLVLLARGDPGRQLALLVYGATSVLLFGTSGLYHTGRWSDRTRARLRRLDHANIFIFIAGTYTPISLTILEGSWKWAIFGTAWGIAALGVLVVAPSLHLPRWLVAGLYVAQGWVAVIALPVLSERAGVVTLLLILGAGLLYSLGAVTYATRRPRLSPRWFGYHEVFHLLVVAANGLFFILMCVEIVPYRS